MKKRISLMTALLLAGAGCAVTHPKTLSLVALGAVGDGKTDDTAAIQKALSAGGDVYIPAGTYLVGPLDLVSHLHLHLDDHATLMFDPNPARYPIVQTRFEGTMEDGHRPCLWGKGLTDVSITGHGTIDGQGASWWATMRRERLGNPTYLEDPMHRRPALFQMRDCDHVIVDGPTFQNSPFWTTHWLFTDHVIVRNSQMLAPADSPNTDAMDIDSCKDVLVEHCCASEGDDAFCLKSGRDADGRKVGRPTEDVTIRHCTVEHAHGGVVIGSEMSGSVRHIHFSDCTFTGTDAGVRIKSTRGRGGVVQDVTADHINMTDVGQAFILTMAYTKTQPQPKSERTPEFSDIHLSNITAKNSKVAGIISGLQELPIYNITFDHLDIDAQQPMTLTDATAIDFRDVKIRCDELPALKQTRTSDIRISDWKEAKRSK